MSYINRTIRPLLSRGVWSTAAAMGGRVGAQRAVATTSRLQQAQDDSIYPLSAEIEAAVKRRGSFIV